MRNHPMSAVALGALLVLSGRLAAVEVVLDQVEPCNLLWLGEHQGLSGQIVKAEGPVEVTLRVTDYWGKDVLNDIRTADPADNDGRIRWDLASLGNGYYEAELSAGDARAQASFGIAPRIERTAAEARNGGYRFGLKMTYMGNIWWRKGAEWNVGEVVDITTKLGLQWTRTEMHKKSELATTELIDAFPMNVVLKVESFPESCFDVDRYGPLEAWIAVNGKAWQKKTVPKKEPYQALLREQLEGISREQRVFEIWNEAWDKMPPEDLAQISNMVAEVILADRPDAIIGANLKGETSEYAYDARFIAAGGMEGMRMVALHPYGKSENRADLRSYREWLRKTCGRDFEIYITEYGHHSTPEGPHKRSEQDQARSVIRQSLALYAEGVSALMPHMMGQREENRTYHEHWMGFYRLNQQPKPNLISLATCARQIDGSDYLGDLWLGEGVGALVFRREGRHVLALYTREGTKMVTVQPGVDTVTVVDMVGGERQVTVVDGGITLEVSEDVTYVVGLSAEVAATASPELDPRRWPTPEKPARNERALPKMARPVFDGDLSDWTQAFSVAMVNLRVNGDDASGSAALAWDEQFLYVALQARDDQIFNTKPRPKLYQEDSLELFVSTEPRDENSGHGPNDYQFFITPTSGAGTPIVGYLADREAGTVVDIDGVEFHVSPTKQGWVAEVAIPWSALSNFKPAAGSRIALEMIFNDADTSHARWKLFPADVEKVSTENPTTWSILNLED